MACSVQSAQEYVRNKRTHLIEGLKNLPLIIEKLHQKKVFNNFEVSELEAIPDKCRKTRKILDWIKNKGEKACYEFLKILDFERKSVLPLELHTWISYFSFAEESDDSHGPTSCHQFRTLLKTKIKQLLGQQWKQQLHFFGGKAQEKFTYVPLVLDTDTEKNKTHNKLTFKSKKSKKPRSKKMRSYIPKDTCRKSPENLLDSQEKSILLVGKPGIGKTTAVKQMLCLWAERQDKNLDFVFYFDKNMLMNIPTTCNLENLLLDTLIMSNADLKQKAEEISQHLEDYSEKVTIIFDGISDFHDNSTLLSIINHELLPEAKIVVTCRPEAEDDDFFDWPTCKVYVQGFNEESIYAYFTQMPDQDPDLLNSVVDNPALFSLCHVPMYAFMVAACFSYYMSEGAHKQCTPTELYIRIFRHCIQRHGNKKLGHLDAHIKGCRDMILLLAESAFSTTRLKTINLEFDCSDNSIAGVFLRSVSVPSPAFAETHCAFLHNTMQEFFSALWLLENPQNVDEVLHLCQTEENKHMKYVIPFLCGLQSETNIPLLKCLFPPNQLKGTFDGFFEKVLNTFLHKDPDEEYFVDAVFLCQCLNEFQSSEACLQFLEGVDYNLDLSEQHLDPQQCCAVSYVISQSRDKPVFLDLENSVVSFSGLKTILRHSLNLRDLPTTLCQVWTESLKCEQQSYLINLLQLCENEIYLPFTIQSALLQHAGEIIIQSADQISLHLYCDKDPQLLSDTFCRTIYTWLPSISSVHFISKQNQRESCEEWEKKVRSFKLNLCLQAVLYQKENVQTTVKKVTAHRPDEECDFLLDLYSHVKQYETETGRRVLPALLPVYQSAPAEWIIDLSERNTSLLLEVLKLQTEKKPVELIGWSDEESEVRSFLQCLPYISQLRYAESLAPYLSELVVNYAEETELMKALLVAMKFTLTVNGVLPYKKCRAMGRVLGLSPSPLNLTLMPQAISLRGATLLFRHITHLHKLCLNQDLIRRMARAFQGACVPLVIKELSVVLTRIWSAQNLSRVLSSLASLLNLWTVQCLDLTECEMEAHSLIGLMSHPGPLTIRLSKESLQEFAALVFEVKDRKLTCFFLERVGGDLTSCSLRWEELIYFSQQRVCHVRVNVRKTKITFEHVRQLVPLLNGIHFKRLSSSVLLSIIREIYESGSAHCVSSLLSSIENCINLNGRELDSVQCAALRFTLQHCTTVSLSMLWTSIPDDELERILPLLNRVSYLCVDRLLLLKLLHRCSVSEHQEGAATTVLSGLQNRLDFSCRTALDLTSQTQDDTLHLSSEDCTVISTVILKAQKHTELILEDCEIQDGGVEVLFSVLHMLRLCCSKALLLQFLDLVHVGEHMFRAVALTNALQGEMDLSRTQLDLQTCRSLALFLEHTEGLSELDLSHCQLSDHCLEQLLPHLHKVTVLDLSHNSISDSSASKIYSNVVISNNTHTVRLFNNRIINILKDKRFEIW